MNSTSFIHIGFPAVWTVINLILVGGIIALIVLACIALIKYLRKK